jgi:hypothetical protein
MVMPNKLTIQGPISSLGPLAIVRGGGQGGGNSGNGSNGSINYADMNPPVIPGFQLEDGSATINGSVGFTINNGYFTGVAVPGLTGDNKAFFNSIGVGDRTATFGGGSSYASAPVIVVQLPNANGGPGAGGLVFFIDPYGTLSYPATFNYPITIS